MTLEAYVQGFGCVPEPTAYEAAGAVVLPVPLEWGGSEVPGVGLGPLAVLGASRFLETYDVALGADPLERGVATLDAVALDYGATHRPLRQIAERVAAIAAEGKLPCCIGGERTLVLGAATGLVQGGRGPVGVLLVSRRPGLLDRWQGREVAPATVGRRLAEALPTCVVGPRWWSAEEAKAMGADWAPAVFDVRRAARDPQGVVEAAASNLPPRLHLSVDVGVLDPAFMPMPGNVEPGGLDWYGLTDLLDSVFSRFEVLGCDVSGFAPSVGVVSPSLTVAQLVLHCLGRMVGAP